MTHKTGKFKFCPNNTMMTCWIFTDLEDSLSILLLSHLMKGLNMKWTGNNSKKTNLNSYNYIPEREELKRVGFKKYMVNLAHATKKYQKQGPVTRFLKEKQVSLLDFCNAYCNMHENESQERFMDSVYKETILYGMEKHYNTNISSFARKCRNISQYKRLTLKQMYGIYIFANYVKFYLP